MKQSTWLPGTAMGYREHPLDEALLWVATLGIGCAVIGVIAMVGGAL